MKTLKTILTTIIVTLFIMTIALFKMGNISIEKIDKEHEATIVVDGVEQASVNYTELFGYNLKINIVDGVYVGR